MSTVSFNTHFPGYDVLGEISRSNARVLKARHVATGDIVAIKHFALNTDADTLRRFERESQIMLQMAHPNIVRIREVRLDTDLPYLVMDYLEGGSLRQLLTQDGCLSVEMTIRVGLQVLNAFRLIHAQGIIHRDVKPENILYHRLDSGELHFLLTDFGVARLHEQPVTVTGQSLMTYEYAAPEQFDNPRQVDEGADYYALGVVLYECLTGKVPFAMRGETGMVTFMNAVLTTPPPAPVLPSDHSLPGSLETLLQQLLAKKPDERIHNPDAVKLALKQAEVEQLHREHGQLAPSPATRTQSHKPIVPHPAPRPVTTTARPVTGSSMKTPARRTVKRLAVITAVLLMSGLAIYYFSTLANRPKSALQPPESSGTVDHPTATEQARDAQDRLELARQQYQIQVAEASKQLKAKTLGGRTGLFGGVKALSVQLKNPSPVAFRSVVIQVQYMKKSGQVLKSALIYYNQVSPNATVTKRAPDSPRGTRFSARVLRADAEQPDSIAASPLNQTL